MQVLTELQLKTKASNMKQATIANAAVVEIIRYRRLADYCVYGYRYARSVTRYEVKADGVTVARNLLRGAAEKLAGRAYSNPVGGSHAPFLSQYIHVASQVDIEEAQALAYSVRGALYLSPEAPLFNSIGMYYVIAPPSAFWTLEFPRSELNSIPAGYTKVEVK
jgi:hypothetical protein